MIKWLCSEIKKKKIKFKRKKDNKNLIYNYDKNEWFRFEYEIDE